MEDQNMHFRHVLLFYFRKGKNARKACEKLREVYGDNALQERQCQRWFSKFQAGNFDIKDGPRSGRPSEVNEDKIQELIQLNPRSTTREISDILGIHHSTVHDHLIKMGYVSKLEIWVPHSLEKVHLMARINICDMLIKREENHPFLKRLITGDEKWIVYNNVVRKRSWCKDDDTPWTTPKANIQQRKVMLSVWWDFKGIVYFEVLPRNETINSNTYCRQLDSLNESIIQKRPELVHRKGVVLHHDNARPHVSLMSRQKILQFGWDVLPHPPYSPDLAPSDFHLFRSLQNSLRGMTFNSDEAINQHLVQFFNDKDKNFYERGIMKLKDRWKMVINQNGQYIMD